MAIAAERDRVASEVQALAASGPAIADPAMQNRMAAMNDERMKARQEAQMQHSELHGAVYP